MEFTLKDEHVRLIRELCFRTETDTCYGDAFCPSVNIKRPFGNSGATQSVFEVLRWEPEGTDGEYTKRQEFDAETLLIELPLALETIVTFQTFEPGTYDGYDWNAAHQYRQMGKYHELKDPLAKTERLAKSRDVPDLDAQMGTLRTMCMNVNGDDPCEEITQTLKACRKTEFTEIAIRVFMEHGPRRKKGDE